MKGNIRSLATTVVLCAGLVAAFAKPAGATTWCVNQGGTNGCVAKIGSAVSAAMPNDTINVAPGTYNREAALAGRREFPKDDHQRYWPFQWRLYRRS